MGTTGIHVIPTCTLWGGASLGYPTIQEREDRDEEVGKESFVIKVQEEALKWAEGEWTKTEEHKGQRTWKVRQGKR
jgi:hypothetical protein